MTIKTHAYYAGYEAKSAEIAEAGWTVARDEFNRANPPGQPWTGSVDGLAYAKGEFDAICDKMDSRHA